MRTYTVTRKKGSKLGNVSYSVGTFSFQFKKGSSIFRGVPEVIAVRVEDTGGGGGFRGRCSGWWTAPE